MYNGFKKKKFNLNAKFNGIIVSKIYVKMNVRIPKLKYILYNPNTKQLKTLYQHFNAYERSKTY